MTKKQKRFCDEYLVDCNATQAAIRAGYSEKTAYSIGQRTLKNVEVQEYINAKLLEISNKKTANAQEVLEYLSAVMRGEHREQVLKLDGDGMQSITDIDVSARDRLKAAELIGKRYGMFKDTMDITGSLPVIISGDESLEDG